jgi:SAM-dependent methyltransferase
MPRSFLATGSGMTGRSGLSVPAKFERGPTHGDEAIASAVWLIDNMCEQLGLEDLGDSEVLDFGCGVKFTQAITNRSLPIKKYVGVDVYGEMIDFLRENVHDPRFEYFHIDAHNECTTRTARCSQRTASFPSMDGRST